MSIVKFIYHLHIYYYRDEKMVEPLPKWIMQRYSALWNKFSDKEFNYEEAFETLNKDKMLSIVLSELRRTGWLEMKLSPEDARKRIYKLKSPEQAVKEMPQIGPKKITKEHYQKTINELNDDEKLILDKISESKGTIFQSDLVDKTKFTKVKITRILNRLEGKGLVERRRSGMTNVIILKH